MVYYPKTEADSQALAQRVSEVHATAVAQQLKSLNCPNKQKLDLLNAVIKAAKEESREQA